MSINKDFVLKSVILILAVNINIFFNSNLFLSFYLMTYVWIPHLVRISLQPLHPSLALLDSLNSPLQRMLYTADNPCCGLGRQALQRRLIFARFYLCVLHVVSVKTFSRSFTASNHRYQLFKSTFVNTFVLTLILRVHREGKHLPFPLQFHTYLELQMGGSRLSALSTCFIVCLLAYLPEASWNLIHIPEPPFCSYPTVYCYSKRPLALLC